MSAALPEVQGVSVTTQPLAEYFLKWDLYSPSSRLPIFCAYRGAQWPDSSIGRDFLPSSCSEMRASAHFGSDNRRLSNGWQAGAKGRSAPRSTANGIPGTGRRSLDYRRGGGTTARQQIHRCAIRAPARDALHRPGLAQSDTSDEAAAAIRA